MRSSSTRKGQMPWSSVLTVNPDNIAIQGQLDDYRAKGSCRAPRQRRPFTVDAHVVKKLSLVTTAGAWVLFGKAALSDGLICKQQRYSGGLLLGKAVVSEFADMLSNVNPGGSSSGSGQVGVGANVIVFAGGSTETDGSGVGFTEVAFMLWIETDGRRRCSCSDAIYGIEHNYTEGQKNKTPKGGYLVPDALKGIGLPWKSTEAQPMRTCSLSFSSSLTDKSALKGATIGTEITNYETIADEELGLRLLELDSPIKSAEYTYIKVTSIRNIETYLSPEVKNTNTVFLDPLSSPRASKFNEKYEALEFCQTSKNRKGIPALTYGQEALRSSLESKGSPDEKYAQALDRCQAGYPKVITIPGGYKGWKPFGLLMQTAWAEAPQIACQVG
ncbi:hypothetical protein CEK25_013448 [Fusarium fujikuroi]|nr:hypothetical protein CEK25_013448 [Fusarium fujikuroi]